MILFLHLDRFYVSTSPVERPVVALRGRTVLDANELAVQAGVRIGMGVSEAKSILSKHPLGLIPLYLTWKEEDYDLAQREWLDRCVPYSDVIEPVDQHEALIDLSNHPQPEAILDQLLSTLKSYRFGLGACRWMAQASFLIGDREGLAYYAPNAFLDELPTSQLLPVAEVARSRLEFLGYRTAGRVQEIPLEVLRQQFGEEAHVIYTAARGRGGDPVQPLYPVATMSERIYFESAVDSTEPIDNALQTIGKKLSDRLEEKDLVSTQVRLIVGYEDGEEVRAREFSKPLQTSRSITFACRLLGSFDKPVTGLRVQLLNVRKANRKQNNLYCARSDSRDVLDKSVREVQKLYGETALKRGREIQMSRRQRLLRAWRDATGWA